MPKRCHPYISLTFIYFPSMEIISLCSSTLPNKETSCILSTHTSEKISVKYKRMTWEEGKEKNGTLNSQIAMYSKKSSRD